MALSYINPLVLPLDDPFVSERIRIEADCAVGSDSSTGLDLILQQVYGQ